LTAECTSLTVTLVLTLRKFLSLIFSVVYFANPFTWRLALGSFLVFSGTLIFSDVPQSIYQKIRDKFQPTEHVKAD
jgi:UDP-xylose/UDP-N-acetylglucosamine transporter B4